MGSVNSFFIMKSLRIDQCFHKITSAFVRMRMEGREGKEKEIVSVFVGSLGITAPVKE